ncbi:MAG: hypothetical protein ACLP59_35365 [Bryobacteraceae bacterium]
MRLFLDFTPDGKIRGEGVDDVAAFLIDGLFNGATSEAIWNKTYIGMHTVQYAGIYSRRSICGDWTLLGSTGGFWIWPHVISDKGATQTEIEEPVEPVVV